MAHQISSLQNSTIKNVVKLRTSGRERSAQGLFVVEGQREISLAQQGGAEVKNLYYCPELIRGKIAVKAGETTTVSAKAFSRISYRDNPDGYLALMKVEEKKLLNLALSQRPLLIILEAVEKPGNLGAILRTADAVGADAVVINNPKTDIYNPNVIRASQGTAFTVPTVVCPASEIIKFCRDRKIKIFATTPETDKDYLRSDFTGGCAIVMGTEDKGLSSQWLQSADERIKIKMRGEIDSLNVSVSTAIILFEAVRQRESKK